MAKKNSKKAKVKAESKPAVKAEVKAETKEEIEVKAEGEKSASNAAKKDELVSAVAERCGLTKKDAGNVMNTFLEVIAESLSNGKNVIFQGFGSFSVVEKAARDNVCFGKTTHIPAHKVVKFKVSKQLQEKL